MIDYDENEFLIEGTELVKYFGTAAEVTVPEGVESIASAFRDGSNAFHKNIDIESITLPRSLKTVGSEAFHGCLCLKNVLYGGSVAEWCDMKFGMFGNPLLNGARLYCGGKPVDDLVIPDGLEKIGNMQFEGGDFLSVTIPASVKTIGNDAFASCKNVRMVGIERGLVSVGLHAFAYCESLKEIILPDGTDYIGTSAFAHCKDLTRAYIPASVERVDSYLFYGDNGNLSVECGAAYQPAGWDRLWRVRRTGKVACFTVNKKLKNIKWGVPPSVC